MPVLRTFRSLDSWKSFFASVSLVRGLLAFCFVEPGLTDPLGLLLIELVNLLVHRGHFVGLAIEPVIAMAAHAAAQAEDFAPGVQRGSHFRDDLFHVALLASRFDVLLVVQRP